MGSLPPSQGSAREFEQHQETWTPAEKAIARKVYENALQRELAEIMQEAKRRAAAIETPAELWELEDYLVDSRKTIDQKYDYRYSVLPLVFAVLLRQGRIRFEDLEGLSEDKLAHLHRAVQFE